MSQPLMSMRPLDRLKFMRGLPFTEKQQVKIKKPRNMGKTALRNKKAAPGGEESKP